VRTDFATWTSFSTLFFCLLFLQGAKADIVKTRLFQNKDQANIPVRCITNPLTKVRGTQRLEKRVDKWKLSEDIELFEDNLNNRIDSFEPKQTLPEYSSKLQEANLDYEQLQLSDSLISDSLTLEKLVAQMLQEKSFQIGEKVEITDESEAISHKEVKCESNKGSKEAQNFKASVLYLMPVALLLYFFRFLLLSFLKLTNVF